MGFDTEFNLYWVKKGPLTWRVLAGRTSLQKNRSVQNKPWDEYLENRNREKSFYRDLFMQNLKNDLTSYF